MLLENKTVIVTGGGRDIGRACVMRLAEEGARVAINYYASGDGAQSAVDEIKAAGGQAFALGGDLTKNADVASLVDKDPRRISAMTSTGWSTLRVVLVARKKIDEMDEDHWNKVMDLNTTSYFRMIKAVEPYMSEGSSIVGFASQAGRDGGGPGAVAYAASKGAAMTMTRGFAKEFGPRIRVNAICPGMIDTDFHNIFTKPEVRTHVANITPLKREGTSEDTANLAVFLVSDQSSFMTGTCIDINGGMLFS